MFIYSAKCWKVSSNIFGIKENKSEENLIVWTVSAPLFLANRSGLWSYCRWDTGGMFSLPLYIWWTVLWFYIVCLIAILITILVYLIQSRLLTSQVHDLVCAPEVLVCLELRLRFIASARSCEKELWAVFFIPGLILFSPQYFYNSNGAGFRHFEAVRICFLLACLDGC